LRERKESLGSPVNKEDSGEACRRRERKRERVSEGGREGGRKEGREGDRERS